MVYALTATMAAPVAIYDAVHADHRRRSPAGPEGLLVHLGRETASGFRVWEVWKSKADHDRYFREAVEPVMAAIATDLPHPPPPSVVEEIHVRGLIIPSAGIGVQRVPATALAPSRNDNHRAIRPARPRRSDSDSE